MLTVLKMKRFPVVLWFEVISTGKGAVTISGCSLL